MLVAGEQRFGLIGDAHAFAPHRKHLVVGHPELDVRFAAVVVLDQPVLALEPIPQRRARQRLQQVHGQQRDLRLLDELQQVPPVSGVSVSRPTMMPETTSMPKPFNVSMAPMIGTIML